MTPEEMTSTSESNDSLVVVVGWVGEVKATSESKDSLVALVVWAVDAGGKKTTSESR